MNRFYLLLVSLVMHVALVLLGGGFSASKGTSVASEFAVELIGARNSAVTSRVAVAPRPALPRPVAPRPASHQASSNTNLGVAASDAGDSGDETSDLDAPMNATLLAINLVYPKLSRAFGEEGRVVVGVRVNDSQSPVADLETSSGFTRLDEAALQAVRAKLASDYRLAAAPPRRIAFRFTLTR